MRRRVTPSEGENRFLNAAHLGLLLLVTVFSTDSQARSLPRSAQVIYEELGAGMEVYGESHIYPGPRFRDDFFCFHPADCRPNPGEPDPINPVMDHLAALADEFIVRTVQETLGSEQLVFQGRTLPGERCAVDLQSLRIEANIQGEVYGDYFRLDWNEDGAWHRYQIKGLTPRSIKVKSQPDLLTRSLQRLFSPRQSGQQIFEMARPESKKIRISLWVNALQPEHMLDWRRRRVTCELVAPQLD